MRKAFGLSANQGRDVQMDVMLPAMSLGGRSSDIADVQEPLLRLLYII